MRSSVSQGRIGDHAFALYHSFYQNERPFSHQPYGNEGLFRESHQEKPAGHMELKHELP